MVSFVILLVARTARIACADRQTDRHNDKPSTVPLAANVRRGLIINHTPSIVSPIRVLLDPGSDDDVADVPYIINYHGRMKRGCPGKKKCIYVASQLYTPLLASGCYHRYLTLFQRWLYLVLSL